MSGPLRTLTRAVVPVVAILLVTAGVARAVSGQDDTFTVEADFLDPSPLIEGNDIRLDGVRVGSIEKMRIVDGGARLTLSLEPTALPLYRDATFSSRPLSLLGERYLDLVPGTAQAGEMSQGAVVPQEQTGSATDLDEVLDVLDKPTSQSLAGLVTALGVGMDGNGEDVAAAVKALAPAMQDTGRLTGVLKDQNDVLASLVDSFEPVASGLAADDGKALDALVASAEQMLTTTSANEAAFRELLKELPSTLTAARRTLTELQGTAEAATPTVSALRPTTRDLTTLGKELQTFADSADPALKSANPVLEEAEKLLAAARPVAQRLREQGPDMTKTVTSLDPLTAELGGEFTTVMEFFKGWALATNGRDGLAHYFRAGLVVTPYSATGLIPSIDGRRPTDITDPGVDEPADDTASVQEQAAAEVGELLGGLLPAQPTQDGGVTGLDQKQERGILGFLLGGS